MTENYTMEIEGNYEDITNIIKNRYGMEDDIAQLISLSLILRDNTLTTEQEENAYLLLSNGENARASFGKLPFTIYINGIWMELLKGIIKSITYTWIKSQRGQGLTGAVLIINIIQNVVNIVGQRFHLISKKYYCVFGSFLDACVQKKPNDLYTAQVMIEDLEPFLMQNCKSERDCDYYVNNQENFCKLNNNGLKHFLNLALEEFVENKIIVKRKDGEKEYYNLLL